MTQPQHPTPEPVKGEIDIEKEAIELWDRLRISMAPADYSSRIIVLEQYISSLCDRARQEEREHTLNEAQKKCDEQVSDDYYTQVDVDEYAEAEVISLLDLRTILASLRTKPVPLKENDHR